MVFFIWLQRIVPLKSRQHHRDLHGNISKKQALLRVTMRVSDIKSRQFCFLLKIQKNYDCFFILYSLLNRFQRRGPLEDIAQRNFTCFTWTDKFKLITWNFLISYFMRQDDLINVHLENFEYFESLQKWLSMSEFMFIENSFIEDNVLFSVT